MKKLLVAALILTAAPALASEPWQENCEAVGDLAHIIMKNRQQGEPLPKMMEIAAGEPVSEKMVAEAYDQPKYNGEEYKTEAADEFRDRWYLDCYKVLKEDNIKVELKL